MTLQIPALYPTSSARHGDVSAGWKLGQVSHGRVIDGGRENLTVTIRGTHYQVTSNLNFTQGEELLLKVSALSPRLEFSIVSRAEPGVRNSDGSGIFFSDKFLQNSAFTQKNINASFLSLINLLQMRTSSPLPPTTALLINSMREKLIRVNGLANPRRLQSALINSSLLLNASSSSNSAESGLLKLLNRIATSLETQRDPIRSLHPGMKYQQALGMSLYLSSDANSLNGFSRNVEEQCAKLMNVREGTLQLMQHDAYRLLAELPVLFRNRVESISIRFMKRKAKGAIEYTEADETECGVEFEFGFDDGMLYTRILIDESQVSVSVGCDKNDTVEYLTASRTALEERLNSYGLDLGVLSVSIHDDYLPLDQESIDINGGEHSAASGKALASIDERRTDEATRAQLREIYTEGRMPALEEFSLNVSNRDLDAVNGIPEQLYCAMACFFAQLYETELT